jgi:hypothetical protein
MINLAAEIEAVANGELIVGVVIGRDDRKLWDAPKDDHEGVLLPWESARPILDYEYNNDFGGADCHPVFAWTASRVIFVHEYDGSTFVNWVPRYPKGIVPVFGGIRE